MRFSRGTFLSLFKRTATIAVFAVPAIAGSCRLQDEPTSIAITAPGFAQVPPPRSPAATGRFHNRSLDHMYRELRAYIRSGKRSRADIIAFSERVCDDFLRANGSAGSCDFKNAANDDGIAIAFSVVSSRGDVLPPARPGRDVSEYGRTFLDQVQFAVDDASSAADVATRVNAIRADANAHLTGEDLEVLLQVAAIADSSSQYWEVNGQAWADITADTLDTSGGGGGGGSCPVGQEETCVTPVLLPPDAPLFWFSWKRVLRGDVVAGIAAGIVSGGAAVGEGAAIGSIYEALTQVLEHVGG